MAARMKSRPFPDGAALATGSKRGMVALRAPANVGIVRAQVNGGPAAT